MTTTRTIADEFPALTPVTYTHPHGITGEPMTKFGYASDAFRGLVVSTVVSDEGDRWWFVSHVATGRTIPGPEGLAASIVFAVRLAELADWTTLELVATDRKPVSPFDDGMTAMFGDGRDIADVRDDIAEAHRYAQRYEPSVTDCPYCHETIT